MKFGFRGVSLGGKGALMTLNYTEMIRLSNSIARHTDPDVRQMN